MPRLNPTLVALVAMTLGAVLLFQTFQTQVSEVLLGFGLHPEARRLLEQSAEDQKRLARWDSDPSLSRARFDEIQALLQRSLIVEQSRREIVRRYERLLLVLFIGTIAVAGLVVAWRQRRDERRLALLGRALGDLAGGHTDLEVGSRGRDAIGRIARMIEETSRRMARDQRRIRSLENLSSWQEAARRHAHEMRTPLTGARLEIERVEGLLDPAAWPPAEEGRRILRGARQELERLARFIQAFTSFAKLPQPQQQPIDLQQLVVEFAATFAQAWPNLELATSPPDVPPLPRVAADRDMVRQVLVNLCDNSSLALGERKGRVSLILSAGARGVLLDVADNGPGVEMAMRGRIFEPYTTTRKIGEGMGLGLAICRKILLDHGGDLELLADAGPGATFRLTFPVLAPDPENA
jgi:two-component system nitrogen regulation sensor histidine kinase NtrY